MSDFRKVTFGFVDSRLLDPTLTALNGMLRAYVQTAQDMDMKIDPASIKEVVELGNKIIGGDFKHFLMANYDHGQGRRARLVRNMVSFLQGKISARMLGQTITADEQFVTTTNAKFVKDPYNGRIEYRNYDEVQRGIQEVEADDVYRVIEGIGPELYARMLITFNGETAYARR